MNTHELASEAVSRSNLYGLLARIARTEVDAALLAELRKPETLAALKEAGADLSLALISFEDADLLEELARSYTHAYILTVNPHESVQRGQGQLWGDHTVAVQDFMDQVGLAMAEERSLLPDHIATELSVMQFLTTEEAKAYTSGDTQRAKELVALQRRFLQEHLGQWGGEFFRSVERLATHDFYKIMAALGRDFLQFEKRIMLGA